MINSPLPLIVLPLLAAVVTFGFQRSATLSALIAAAIPIGLAIFAWVTPLDGSFSFLGRELFLTTGDRLAIVIIFLTSAAVFLGVWRTTPNWTYYPIALAALAAVVAALGARPVNISVIDGRPFDPFQYSVLFMTIAIALSIFPLQGGQPGVASGTLRYMILMVIALPAFLAAAWTLDQYSQSPDAANLAQASIALLLLGIALWLGLAPFHSWLPKISSEAPPLSSAFVLGVINIGAWFLLLDMLHEIKVLGDPSTFAVLRAAGILSAVVGGSLAFAQRDFGRLMGYAILGDIGVALAALSTHTDAGLTAALIVVIVRIFGLGLMTIGLAIARRYALRTLPHVQEHPDDTFESMTGLAWRMPWAALAIIVGGFSLAGVPPFAGFTGRWAALQQVAGTDLLTAIALLISTIGVAIGTLRGLQSVLKPIEPADTDPTRESRINIALILGALALSLIIGLFPDVIAPALKQMVAAFAIK
ncbi:MAG TPA: proton-conducting transporter membrane subunit [Anaerolineae bacterium]|nr:proton-conducting transporter membrane subunit [Anaerolineae bacterium]